MILLSNSTGNAIVPTKKEFRINQVGRFIDLFA